MILNMTPVLGLSVLIHLLVILYYKIIGVKTQKKSLVGVVRIISPTVRLFSTYGIITVVFTIVALNAAFLVYASGSSKYSTISFIDNAIENSRSSVITYVRPLNNSESLTTK